MSATNTDPTVTLATTIASMPAEELTSRLQELCAIFRHAPAGTADHVHAARDVVDCARAQALHPSGRK